MDDQSFRLGDHGRYPFKPLSENPPQDMETESSKSWIGLKANVSFHGRPVTAATFLGMDTEAFAIATSRTIEVYEVASLFPLDPEYKPTVLTGHTSNVTSLIASSAASDSDLLISGGADGTVHAWSARQQKQLYNCYEHTAAVTSLTIEPKERWFASCCEDDHRVAVWDATSGKKITTLGAPASVLSISIDAAGKHLLALDETNGITIWEAGTWRKLKQVAHEPTNDDASCVLGLPGFVVSCAETINVWSMKSTITKSKHITYPYGPINCFWSSTSLRRVYAGQASGLIRVFDRVANWKQEFINAQASDPIIQGSSNKDDTKLVIAMKDEFRLLIFNSTQG